jgi:hypothetical protein
MPKTAQIKFWRQLPGEFRAGLSSLSRETTRRQHDARLETNCGFEADGLRSGPKLTQRLMRMAVGRFAEIRGLEGFD